MTQPPREPKGGQRDKVIARVIGFAIAVGVVLLLDGGLSVGLISDF